MENAQIESEMLLDSKPINLRGLKRRQKSQESFVGSDHVNARLSYVIASVPSDSSQSTV